MERQRMDWLCDGGGGMVGGALTLFSSSRIWSTIGHDGDLPTAQDRHTTDIFPSGVFHAWSFASSFEEHLPPETLAKLDLSSLRLASGSFSG